MHRLNKAKKRVVGFKQSLKALEKGEAQLVFIALDADNKVADPLRNLCQQKDIPMVEVDTMIELGRSCGIQVGTAVAVLVEA